MLKLKMMLCVNRHLAIIIVGCTSKKSSSNSVSHHRLSIGADELPQGMVRRRDILLQREVVAMQNQSANSGEKHVNERAR